MKSVINCLLKTIFCYLGGPNFVRTFENYSFILLVLNINFLWTLGRTEEDVANLQSHFMHYQSYLQSEYTDSVERYEKIHGVIEANRIVKLNQEVSKPRFNMNKLNL